MKVRIRKKKPAPGRRRKPAFKVALALAVVAVVIGLAGLGVCTYYYVYFARLIDRRLSGHVFANTSHIYAAPEPVFVGEAASVEEIAGRLRRAGYSENKNSSIGWYQLLPGGIEVFPGPDSYFADEPALVRVDRKGLIQRIVSLKDNSDRQRYDLEPELITNLFDRSRQKRRLVKFEDLPPDLVNAILAIEDKNFFQHSGIDFLRILKAAYLDLRAHEAAQGASTLTQQLAGGFFLNRRERTMKRKLEEAVISLQLEHRLTKQQIFEDYVNQINMGQRGSFSINGMGEAALVYFGKDIRQLTLSEAAFLAGIIRGPSYYSPYRHPERARERRNHVLDAMVRIGAINQEQHDAAAREPLEVLPSYGDAGDAPYFVDLVKDQLLESYSEKDLVSESYRVYTTLDPDLQKDAAEAIRVGIQEADQILARRRKRTHQTLPQVQAALVALDPHTGEVKALIGGRDYGDSQLNRAVAKRQPGSSFKPFVYAAAFNSAVDGSQPVITPSTSVVDEPTTFEFNGQPYEPNNFGKEFYGRTTLRNALAHSLNVATVKVAEMTGYQKVADLAHQAGILGTKATPAEALGSYESTPLEMAGAYTVFANGGEHLDPIMIRLVRAQDGAVLEEERPQPRRVLDPRVAYLMTSLMEGVMQYGTAAGVRARGFTAPAAGKTGTSRDGWFAGYTTNLLCVVWVGFDDNRDLKIEGAKSALPIWTAFMKKALTLRRYRNPPPFEAAPGVVSVEIDPETGMLATPSCPTHTTEVFIEGSQPTQPCNLHGMQTIAQPFWRSGPFLPLPGAYPTVQPPAQGGAAAANSPGDASNPKADGDHPQKKRNFFERIFGIGKPPAPDNSGKPQQ